MKKLLLILMVALIPAIGFAKKTQKTPQKEIEKALGRSVELMPI